MTDSRLPGHWLTDMRYADLTDRAWRVLCGALMWSNEQGTDGIIPTRYLRNLHPDGDVDAAIAELEAAGILIRTDDGITLPGWSDPRGLRQSTSAQVEQYRSRKAANQSAYRQRRRSDSASGHVTGNVGEGFSTRKASAYVTGNTTGNVTGHAGPLVTVKPGSDCGPGNHRRLADGTCTRCDSREDVA